MVGRLVWLWSVGEILWVKGSSWTEGDGAVVGRLILSVAMMDGRLGEMNEKEVCVYRRNRLSGQRVTLK